MEKLKPIQARNALITTGLVAVPMLFTTFYKANASPDTNSNESITVASVQQALDNGNANTLINMISNVDQSISNLQEHVNQNQELLNKSLIDTQNAQNQLNLANLSLSGAKNDQKNAEDQAEIAKKQLDNVVKQSYMIGVSPGALQLLASGSNDSKKYMNQSVLAAQLVKEAQDKFKAAEIAENKAANSSSISLASKNQSEVALENASEVKKNAEQQMQQAVSQVNQARNVRRDLEVRKSLAQAALDSTRQYKDNIVVRKMVFNQFQTQLANRVIQASPKSGLLDVLKPLGFNIPSLPGLNIPTLPALPSAKLPALPSQAVSVINSIPILKDLPGVGLLTGAQSIDPLKIVSDTVQTFVTSSFGSGGNLITGTVKTIQVPIDALAKALGLQNLIPGMNNSSATGSYGGGPIPYAPIGPHLTGEAGINAVIARGESVIGVPYAWGGGSYTGPTLGVHDGGVADSYGDYKKIGFDCSGLMMYAFAAAGIQLPHYSGYQYNSGPHVPLAQMRRGDMIFYGPGGSEHVALILGDGKMLEAPESGETVMISPVRTSGACPYVVRMFS